MRAFLSVCALLFFLLSPSYAQPQYADWSAVFITDDAPFMQTCGGNVPLNNHTSVFIYYDDDGDGPDSANVPPHCIPNSGQLCFPEEPVFSYRNYPLGSDGTLHGPVFWCARGLYPPVGSLPVRLRIFIGLNNDTCYTSPTVYVPYGGQVDTVIIPSSDWTCGATSFSPPECFGDPGYFEFYLPSLPTQRCISTCTGGETQFAVRLATNNNFRPPVIEIVSGCDSGCEPAVIPSFYADHWQFFSAIQWWFGSIIGRDVGCVTVRLMDSIACARLDTMTVTEVGQGTEIHWNTTRETALDSFLLWQTVPGNFHVADVPAHGTGQYDILHPTAFDHGGFIAYLLTMVDSSGQQFGAAYVEYHRSLSNDRTRPNIGDNSLSAPWPNPFNATTEIRLTISATQKSKVEIVNLLGRHVTTLHDGMLEAGEHRFTFDGSNLPSAIYFAQVQAGEFVKTQKLLLLK